MGNKTDTANLIFQIIQAIGAVGTFGAFLFLFKKNKEAQGQIEKLSNIAEKIEFQSELNEKRLKLSVMPKLFTNGGSTRGYEGELQINLGNKGERAYLKEFILESGDIEIHNEHLPWEMDKDSARKIMARSNGAANINDTAYRIKIIYHDEIGTIYNCLIEGTGGNPKVIQTREM